MADLGELGGIGFVREYMPWGGVNPRPGEAVWGRRGETADLYARRAQKRKWTKTRPKLLLSFMYGAYLGFRVVLAAPVQ